MQLEVDKNQFKEALLNASNIAILCADRGTDCVASAVALAKYIEIKFKKIPIVVHTGEFDLIDPELLGMLVSSVSHAKNEAN